jgi:chromosome segregation ATPase
MKTYSSIILILVCAVLVIALIVIKHGDDTQHQTDAGSIADFSNQLAAAQFDLTLGQGAMINLSNNLDQCQSESVALSNQLTAAQSNLALDAEQITNLTTNLDQQSAQLSAAQAGNQALTGRITDLTNAMAGMAQQLVLTNSSLVEVDKNYSLLENRLRRDVAARLVAERKFDNPPELQAQLKYLKQHPGAVVTADHIYADLDVEVKSNQFHVISP